MYCCNHIDSGLSFGVGGGTPGSGTVTSVDASIDALFAVSGVPITTAGTIVFTLNTVSANLAFLGPVSGGDAAPAFRAITAYDLNTTFINGDALVTDGSGNLAWASVGGTGTVTSVGLSADALFTVGGSPITGSGTLTLSINSVAAHLVFAGPSSGGAVAPTMRQLVASDMNTTFAANQYLRTDVSGNFFWSNGVSGTVTSVAMSVPTSLLSVSGSPITSSGTLAVTLATQTAHLFFIGPSSGSPAAPTFRAAVASDFNTTFAASQVLSTDGSGNLSWVTASSGTVAGSSTQIQYNNSGSFGASANFTWDFTDNALLITRPNSGTTLYAAKIVNSFVSGSTGQSLFITHNDTGAGSAGIRIDSTASSLGYGIYISTFGTSGTGIFSSAGDNRVCIEAYRTGVASTNPGLFSRQGDSSAANVFSAAGYDGATRYILSVWGLDSDNPGAARGTVGVRLQTAPTNGVVEMPWITGDNKPTLYIGSSSAAQSGLYVQSGSSATAAVLVNTGLVAFWVKGSGITQVATGGQDIKMTTVGGMLYADNTDHANGGSVETTLATYSLDSNSLAATADSIRVTATFIAAANTNVKTFKLKFGSTTVYTSGGLVANNDVVTIEAIITRTGSNTQRISTKMQLDNNAGTTVTQAQYTTATETDSSAIVISCTGQGTSSSDITQKMFMIEFLNHFA